MGLLNYLGGRGSSAGGEGWFVLVTLVRALAITVFESITDFNAEAGNPENGKV